MVGGSIIAVKQATPRRKGDRAKRQDLAGDVAGGDEDLFTLCTHCIHQRPATTAFPSLRGTPRCPASDVTRLEAPTPLSPSSYQFSLPPPPPVPLPQTTLCDVRPPNELALDREVKVPMAGRLGL